MIERVQQEHQFGCQVAVLAMIMGISYKKALTYYPGDPDKLNGFGQHVLENILVEQGYAVARMYQFTNGNQPRDVWPPLPFDLVHWCQVETQAGTHAVIMMEDGTVLDPWKENRTSLDHPDYKRVNFVAAIVPRSILTNKTRFRS